MEQQREACSPFTIHNSQSSLTLSSSSVVYYCVDDWGKFENLDGGWLEEKERELLARADVVFTPAKCLAEKCERAVNAKAEAAAGVRCQVSGGVSHPAIHYVPHGVEYARFAAALDLSTRIPADIAALAGPIIGFYGNIYPWIDFGLLEQLARARPAWTFVMIGQVYCEVSGLLPLPNVRFLGRREHDLLPGYCRAFDAAIIPYDMKHPRMESVNPVKTKELLAAGVPVVAADVPELRGLSPHVRTCRSTDEWLEALDEATRNRDRQAISRSVAGEDWGLKVKELRRVVERGVLGRGTAK